MHSPHIGFQTILEPLRERMFGSLAVIDGHNGHLEIIGPGSSVSLMDERTHTDEAASVDMKDNRLWSWVRLVFDVGVL